MEGYGDAFAELELSVAGFNWKSVILLAFIVLSAVLLFLSSGNSNYEKTVAVRSKMTASVLLSVFALFLLFMGDNILLNALFFLVMTIIIAYEFSYINNTSWADLFLALFLMLVVANHYYFKIL